MNPQVDPFFDRADKWQDEMRCLRTIALECGLKEEYKWSQPCYTYNGKNIAIVSAFKDYAFVSFFKGALLSDANGVLKSPGENAQSGRLIAFKSVAEIEVLSQEIKAFLFEAIEIEKLGLKVKTKAVEDFDFPNELHQKFAESPALKSAFEALTPGRQKGYLLHFTQAKQAATRIARIEKYAERILMGKGIRDCVCGHSKRMPSCDGSHKHFA